MKQATIPQVEIKLGLIRTVAAEEFWKIAASLT